MDEKESQNPYTKPTPELRTPHRERPSTLSPALFQSRAAKHNTGSRQQKVRREEEQSGTLKQPESNPGNYGFLISETKENKTTWEQNHEKPRAENGKSLSAW